VIAKAIFSDERFLGLTTHQRLLLLGLMTFQDKGRVALGPNQLQATVFGCDHSVGKSGVKTWLCMLAHDGFIDSGEWNDNGKIFVNAYHESATNEVVEAAIEETVQEQVAIEEPAPTVEVEVTPPPATAPASLEQIAKYATTLPVDQRLDAEGTLRQLAEVIVARRVDWAAVWGCFAGHPDPISEAASIAEWVHENRDSKLKRPFAMVSRWLHRWRDANPQAVEVEAVEAPDYSNPNYDPYSGVVPAATTKF
jgi:hypothetical protein